MRKQITTINRRVLVIDDNPSIHEDFKKILNSDTGSVTALEADELLLFGEPAARSPRPQFELDSAFQGQAGVEKAHEALKAGRPYALAFIDMRMPPGWDGLETIERLWQIDPDIQVVICSAHGDYDWTDLVYRLGHADQLLVIKKPFEPIEVLQCANALTRKWQNEWAVRCQVEALEQVVTDRTQGLEAANKQLRHLATHDTLTGLPNRALLEDRVTQAMAQTDISAQPFALLLFDLDRFKVVNDSMGHSAGDEFLKEIAMRLRQVTRAGDTIGRLGGDEFVMILLSIHGADDALRISERVLKALEPPIRIQGVDLQSSTSIGIAVYPADADSMATLFNRADAAMYFAKQEGRNRAFCFAPGMNASTRAKIKLESDLKNALERGQLELHYQPKVDTHSGAIHSAEALLRWRHPEHGFIPPSEFIPVAEESGLISAIGEWVVREACRQARAWQDEGLSPIRVAINLSPSQFRHGNLLATMRQALDDSRLEPRYLEVELTESTVMSDAEGSVTILEQLSQMGVLVSVDDFGTGYSSMSYLRRFPVDKLKIDRAFISDIASRPDDACIVSAIISLAHSLRLKVVAEGVETNEQLDFLKSLGCDQYQGYLCSPAVPPLDFADILRRAPASDRSFMDVTAIRTHSKLSVYRR